MTLLHEMLTYKRPSRSKTEEVFIDKFIKSGRTFSEDEFGNVYIIVGESSTLFSCHTDTVHRTEGVQNIIVDEMFTIVYKDDKEILGADNTAGVWIMLKLIDNNIPGVYVFHKDEEIGGGGSRWIAKNRPEQIANITKAIAFDRKGQNEVITHQFMGRCCSDVFGNALADAIGLNYAISDQGIFTDTANYVDFIPECTNISVGYENEHTPSEFLDYGFLVDNLMHRLLLVNFEELPVERDITKMEIEDIDYSQLNNWM